MSLYAKRLERLRQAMRQWGADLLFLNYGPDFTYISGILKPLYYEILKTEGDWITGLIIGLDHDPVLVLHKYFAVNIEAQTWIQDIRILPDDHDPDAFLAQVVAEFAPSANTIAVNKMLWGQSLLSLQGASPNAHFVAVTNDQMDAVRVVKDEEELRLMRRAAEITDLAMGATLQQMRIGMTERDVATEVLYQIKRHGGDGDSFYPGIICVGNDSNPDRHIFTRNTDMILAAGTTVAFDYGVLYQGYCSDFGRSVFMGEPNADALSAYRTLARIIHETAAVMADGQITPAQIADYARDIAVADGFGDTYFYLGLGHSIGLEVHESPWLRPGFDEPISAGMCFTLEPKIWEPGIFYVRCEDVVVVGVERATALTKFSYEPNVIDT